MKKNGLWISPTEFVQFSEPRGHLLEQIATRSRSPDFYALGMYLPNPDPVLKALGKDIKIYRELRADAQVGGNMRRRKSAVKALEWGVKPDKASASVATSIQDILTDLPMRRIISEVMDAPFYGYQPLEVIWGKVGSYLVPVDVIGKPPEWFVFDDDNQLRLRTKKNSLNGEELPERKFLLATQDASYDNPYGFPDLSMCFWPTTFKKGGLKFWVQFSEKYGMPWVVGHHPRSASTKETDDLLDDLERMVQDAVAVIPDDSSIKIMETASAASNAETYERLLMFCRSEVNIALLGQNQSTEANSTKASAKAGLEVTDDIRDGDADIVEDVINTLIEWTHELNWPSGARPQFKMWEQKQVDEVQAGRDEKLTRAGAKFTPAYFKRSYGLQDGDLVEEPAVPGAAEFAEGDADDMDALDAALDALPGDELNADAQALLAPVFEAARSGASLEALRDKLVDIYPQMDATALQERLARVIFVSKMLGRLNA